MRGLVTVLWRQAVLAIPMALFFGTVYASGPMGFLRVLQMSLVFAYVIGLLLWALKYFILPRLPEKPGESHTGGVLRISFIYTLTSIFGAGFSAWLVHMTIMPGFLGSGRGVAVVGMYTLLFSVLFTGVVLAFIFYRDAIKRARAEQELEPRPPHPACVPDLAVPIHATPGGPRGECELPGGERRLLRRRAGRGFPAARDR